MSDDKLAHKIIDMNARLRTERGTWESHWSESAKFTLPRKRWVQQFEGHRTQGEERSSDLYDSNAQHSLILMAAALHGLLTNPVNKFFGFTSGVPELDTQQEVRKWMAHASDQIFLRLNQVNFQTEIHENYLDQGCFGTGLFRIDDTGDDDLFNFKEHPVSEFCIAESNKGTVNMAFREFQWSLKQIVEEFGKEVFEKDISGQLSRKFASDPLEKFTVIHAVLPQGSMGSDLETTPGLKLSKVFEFGSVYVLKQLKMTLQVSGFREFPFAVPRWLKTSDEVYGRSPAMQALADIRMLDAMKQTTIQSAQLAMAPPMQMPNNTDFLPLRFKPYAVNFYRAGSKDRIEPLLTAQRIDFGIELMRDTRQIIREAFFVDQFQTVATRNPQMTATEVQERLEESLRLLGPILSRQNFELLGPTINRCLQIAIRRGAVEPPPKVLQGRNLKVSFISPIAQAQRTREAESIPRGMAMIAQLLEAKPEAMDLINEDYAVRHISDVFSWPVDLIRSKREVEEIRKSRAEAQQQVNDEQSEAIGAQTAKVQAEAIRGD